MERSVQADERAQRRIDRDACACASKRYRARVSATLLDQRRFSSTRTPALRDRFFFSIGGSQVFVQPHFTGFLLDRGRRQNISVIWSRTTAGSCCTLARRLFVCSCLGLPASVFLRHHHFHSTVAEARCSETLRPLPAGSVRWSLSRPMRRDATDVAAPSQKLSSPARPSPHGGPSNAASARAARMIVNSPR